MTKKIVVIFLMAMVVLFCGTVWAGEKKGIVSFTFDDDWRSQFSIAFPVLAKYGFVGTVYIYTDAVENNWPGYMTVEQLALLKKSSWEIGSHTKSHSSLTSLETIKQEEELIESQNFLSRFGPIKTLSFPYRHFNEETLKLAEKHYGSFKSAEHKKINLRPFPRFLNDFEINSHTKLEEIEIFLKEAVRKTAG